MKKTNAINIILAGLLLLIAIHIQAKPDNGSCGFVTGACIHNLSEGCWPVYQGVAQPGTGGKANFCGKNLITDAPCGGPALAVTF